ncbi:response regulator transcription factor [Desulfuribacillus alkaliarsenatis]|uniref:DNA-binding response regulator n=1 Tax=Desulfuribacillus alkaliarsenatis TaxID=766136 RepID=A0A1E5FZY3_9FIRM|nr:response regulator transcription factor [Desulfuribacillus alkaliarsenatis]OEF96090.1 DNA-binding response regulator [Desulfuribacillus alkaliarsenatis]
MTQEKKILVVDDEPKIVDIITMYLKKDGFLVRTAYNGRDALKVFREWKPSLIILDLMMPEMTGEQTCEAIRKESNVPIIMLTAKSDENERIKGLSIGADDYLVKPFSPRELVVRVRTVLRRFQPNELLADILSFNDGELEIDATRHEVKIKGKVVDLTPNEFKLLLVLAKNPHRTFNRTELLEKVQGYNFEGYDRTIDAHIKNLRKKIEEDQKNPKYVKTVYGMGYKFDGN